MLRIASVVFALALAGTAFASPSLTGQYTGPTSSAPDQEVCFSQLPGTCDGGTFVSAIVSQLGVTAAGCGGYGRMADSRSADEFICDGPPVGFHWWATYFGDTINCVPIGCNGPTFNFYFYLGGTTCPEEALLFAQVDNEPVATCNPLSASDYEYTAAPDVPGGIPPDFEIYMVVQINEEAFPQWGWTESAVSNVGGDPCIIAPEFGINTWTPISTATGGPWCGQAFEVFKEVATPVESSSWGLIKGTYNN